ncbi:MAG: hypothetical protein VB055_08420 [Oscillospiraceae bacterium]|nr:hypothetical protein [Oscillospiraceae bacterium]
MTSSLPLRIAHVTASPQRSGVKCSNALLNWSLLSRTPRPVQSIIGPAKYTFSSAPQFWNKFKFDTLFTPLPIVTLVSALQSWNALFWMLVTLFGIVTLVSALHPSNA